LKQDKVDCTLLHTMRGTRGTEVSATCGVIGAWPGTLAANHSSCEQSVGPAAQSVDGVGPLRERGLPQSITVSM